MDLFKITSISKKVLLALVGLFLVIFLLVHLGINLCLLRSDNGVWFYNATQFMGTNYIVKAFEIVLFAAIFIHIGLAIALQIQNWRSRPVRYKVKSKSKTATGSKYMIWTGGMVLCFLVLHFWNFYFVKMGLVDGKYLVTKKHIELYIDERAKEIEENPSPTQQAEITTLQEQVAKIENLAKVSPTFLHQEILTNLTKAEVKELFGEEFTHYEPDFYNLCKELFVQKVYSIIYLLLFVALGFHLYHAFKSAFQTLGLNHNKYNKVIKCASFCYSIFIVVGFSIIPVYFMFFFKQ